MFNVVKFAHSNLGELTISPTTGPFEPVEPRCCCQRQATGRVPAEVQQGERVPQLYLFEDCSGSLQGLKKGSRVEGRFV